MTSMREFWDERAREDAFYFVDNRIKYKDPAEEARFWEMGSVDLDRLLGAVDVELRPEWLVVEIGCVVGRLTRVISERVASVKALDLSSEMLAIAGNENAGLANVEWIHGDGVSLSGIRDGVADAVVSHVVFQHIPDPEITLGYVREIGRVLRSGGWAAFQVSNDPKVHRPRGRAARLRVAVQRALRRHDDFLEHPHWLGSHVEIPALRAAA